jgi:xanthine dehydrogenase YagS FAD-binding subunit
MKAFAHANARSVEAVVGVLSETCRPLAGGTDLLSLMKADLAAPERLVNLKTLADLAEVRADDAGWHIGATARLSQVAQVMAEALGEQPALACLHAALVGAASPQLRHMATLGGNLVQQPRCWYYRNPNVPCWRKGGQRCFAVQGNNVHHTILGRSPCNAVHPSDPAVALLALDASVTIVGADASRQVPLGEFYRLPTRERRHDHSLAWDELITEVLVPNAAEGTRGVYVKISERSAWDFALVSVAACVTMAGDTVQRARLALGGVAPRPWRASEAEAALAGQPLTDAAIEAAAQAATIDARPMAHNAYKVDLVHGAVRQALERLG